MDHSMDGLPALYVKTYIICGQVTCPRRNNVRLKLITHERDTKCTNTSGRQKHLVSLGC